MQQQIKKSEKKASKIPFYLFIRVYLFLLLRDLITGINTKAPDMRIIMTSGPSILGVEVSTKKQSAAQHKVSTTHCV